MIFGRTFSLRRLPTASLFTHYRFIDDWFSGKWYYSAKRRRRAVWQ